MSLIPLLVVVSLTAAEGERQFEPLPAAECLPTRDIEEIVALDDRHVAVDTRRRQYLITLLDDCPTVGRIGRVPGFETVIPDRICGRQGERMRSDMARCRIQGVEVITREQFDAWAKGLPGEDAAPK